MPTATELLHDLFSRLPPSKRETGFLLPETTERYAKYLAKALQTRTQRIAAVARYGKQCVQEAKELRRQARNLSASVWETVAESELARRDAKRLRDEGLELRRKGKEFIRAALWMRVQFRMLPETFDPEKRPDRPPSMYWNCTSKARREAKAWEANKIATEGAVIRSARGEGANDTYWLYERRLMQYDNRIFLVVMAKREDAAPHTAWEVSWVSDSTADMNEEELRVIASGLLDSAPLQ